MNSLMDNTLINTKDNHLLQLWILTLYLKYVLIYKAIFTAITFHVFYKSLNILFGSDFEATLRCYKEFVEKIENERDQY